MSDETLRDVFMRHRMSTVISREYVRNQVVTLSRCTGCGHETTDPSVRTDHLIGELEKWAKEVGKQ